MTLRETLAIIGTFMGYALSGVAALVLAVVSAISFGWSWGFGLACVGCWLLWNAFQELTAPIARFTASLRSE